MGSHQRLLKAAMDKLTVQTNSCKSQHRPRTNNNSNKQNINNNNKNKNILNDEDTDNWLDDDE